MIGIVKLALRRPYTFIVMALLIMISGVASALRTPTDIFPSINIPVISVVFSYTGLSPDDMSGRIAASELLTEGAHAAPIRPLASADTVAPLNAASPAGQ